MKVEKIRGKILAMFLVVWVITATGTTVFLEAANGSYASNPDPADGAGIEGEPYPEPPAPTTHIWTMLIFDPGLTAVKHTAYFSDDYSKVYNRHQDANLGQPPYPYPGWDNIYFVGNPEVPPAIESLVRNTTYYWCVDETDALGTTYPGDVWEFTIMSYYATEPDPLNEAINVNTDVLLSWQPGYDVDAHDVYIGTSWDLVFFADEFDVTGIYKGWTIEPNYQCSNLAFNTKYYWRIDEVHDRIFPGSGTIYKGDVWCFTTVGGEAQPDYPEDGAEITGDPYPPDPSILFTELIFVPGATAVKHTGYFSEDYSKVYDRHQDANLGQPPLGGYPGYEYTYFAGNPDFPPAVDSLVRGVTYYWCVDETDALGTTYPGDVWEFTVMSYYATKPDPPNEAININPDVLLSWQPGYSEGILAHDVYIGTSWEDVNNADEFDITGIYQGWDIVPNYQCSNLAFNTKYYWRIDEVHDRSFPGTGTIYKGDVWCFTTVDGEAQPDYPEDGAAIPGEPYPDPPGPTTHIWTMLIFEPGLTAVKHTGYFSDDYSKVYNRHQDANLGPPPFPYPGWDNIYFVGNPEVPPAIDSLVRGVTYYWCVDETDALGTTYPGDVWEFTIQDYKASSPNPPDEAVIVDFDVLLSWNEGVEVDEHDVYMGTSWEDVNNAVYDPINPPPEYLGTYGYRSLRKHHILLAG
ncbi:MAG: hypothetical protein ACYSYL_16610 [Planctomycetota bacterium]|jgi:hypothetical protein